MDRQAMDSLQAMRDSLGLPIVVNSGYRCAKFNAAIKGAKKSRHMLGLAFDVSTLHRSRAAMIAAARRAGFRGIGLYPTWLHVDIREHEATWGDE